MITVSINGLGDHSSLKVELSAVPRVGEEICVGGALFDVVATSTPGHEAPERLSLPSSGPQCLRSARRD
jgi:hypothetical protein